MEVITGIIFIQLIKPEIKCIDQGYRKYIAIADQSIKST
jgi:hypothetical protein